MKRTLLFIAMFTLALTSCVDGNNPQIDDQEDPTLQEPASSMERRSSTMLTPTPGENLLMNNQCVQECPQQWRCDIASAICNSTGGSFSIVGQCDHCGCPYECRSRQSGEVVGTSWCGPARIIVPC